MTEESTCSASFCKQVAELQRVMLQPLSTCRFALVACDGDITRAKEYLGGASKPVDQGEYYRQLCAG